MSPLESRKQLLIAESELNRSQMEADLAALKTEIVALSDRAKSISSIASSVAMLVAGLAGWRRGTSIGAPVKHSWVQRILKGMGLVSTIWLAFRSQRGREKS